MLQRELARHPAVCTCSEPWFLLPLFSMGSGYLCAAPYGANACAAAINDLKEQLPDGDATFNKGIRRMADFIYEALSASKPGARYFVDKTPRYDLIPFEIARTFPDAKILILWRNPLAIAASMMTTWAAGKWNLQRCTQDLRLGILRLIEFSQSGSSNFHTVHYEDFIARPDEVRMGIYEYLGLEQAQLCSAPEVPLLGRMGDPTQGNNVEARIRDPRAWREQFDNPLRRRWARGYLRWLGQERLSAMGYDLTELTSVLEKAPTRMGRMAPDAARMIWGPIHNMLNFTLIGEQRLSCAKGDGVMDLK